MLGLDKEGGGGVMPNKVEVLKKHFILFRLEPTDNQCTMCSSSNL